MPIKKVGKDNDQTPASEFYRIWFENSIPINELKQFKLRIKAKRLQRIVEKIEKNNNG